MATQDVQGKDETKLANGGGAFPFWVSVVIVAGFSRSCSGSSTASSRSSPKRNRRKSHFPVNCAAIISRYRSKRLLV